MNDMDILCNIFILVFAFVSSFLIHELMHIKSQGVLSTGRIRVNEYGMTCTTDNVVNNVILKYSGGVYTSIVMFICAVLSSGFWQDSFILMGWMQLLYGIYEGYSEGKVGWRYLIYVGVFIVWLLVTIIRYGVK
jgi:hypothetical protein